MIYRKACYLFNLSISQAIFIYHRMIRIIRILIIGIKEIVQANNRPRQ